jgi:protein-disulfide isomerase
MLRNNKSTIALSIVVAALIIGGAILYVAKPSKSPSSLNKKDSLSLQGLSFEGMPILGDPNASVTILEFGDFQCPYCAIFFAQVEPVLKKEFIETKKANIVFKTLAFLGKESVDAGNAAECAGEQGKFWQMHQAIFEAELAELSQGKNNENSGNLNRQFFESTAEKLGLDKEAFLSCFDQNKYVSKLDKFMSDAQKAMNGRVGTPAVFVIKDKVASKMDKTQQGPFDIDAYRRIINEQ